MWRTWVVLPQHLGALTNHHLPKEGWEVWIRAPVCYLLFPCFLLLLWMWPLLLLWCKKFFFIFWDLSLMENFSQVPITKCLSLLCIYAVVHLFNEGLQVGHGETCSGLSSSTKSSMVGFRPLFPYSPQQQFLTGLVIKTQKSLQKDRHPWPWLFTLNRSGGIIHDEYISCYYILH